MSVCVHVHVCACTHTCVCSQAGCSSCWSLMQATLLGRASLEQGFQPSAPVPLDWVVLTSFLCVLISNLAPFSSLILSLALSRFSWFEAQ